MGLEGFVTTAYLAVQTPTSFRTLLHRTEFDPIKLPVLVFIPALLLHGAWVLHYNNTAAINPYNSSFKSDTDCMKSCCRDPDCNGYSIDTSNNGCYLSNCDYYDVVPSCSTCKFASKLSPISTVICPPETTTSNDSATTTPGADTSSEPATTPDRGMSTTVSTDVNGVDGLPGVLQQIIFLLHLTPLRRMFTRQRQFLLRILHKIIFLLGLQLTANPLTLHQFTAQAGQRRLQVTRPVCLSVKT